MKTGWKREVKRKQIGDSRNVAMKKKGREVRNRRGRSEIGREDEGSAKKRRIEKD